MFSSNLVLFVCFLATSGIVNGAGVDMCGDCDVVGSLSGRCDLAAGGLCLDCKPGVGGLKCDQCLAQYYNFSQDGCSDCGCHPNASTDRQCDDAGVCQCVATATGDKCSVCADGYHVIESGCVACSPCYDEVADQFSQTVELYNDFLRQINTSLARLNSSGSGEGSGDFVSPELLERLEGYQVTLEDLLTRAINATEREREVEALLNSLIEEVNILEEDVIELELNVSSAESETFELSEGVEQIRDNLTLAEEQVMSSEAKLMEIWRQLEMTMRLNRRLQRQFAELVDLATAANITAHEKDSLAQSLLDDVTCALENATNALELLNETIALQNATLAVIQTFEEEVLPPLIDEYMEARSAFANADRDVTLALNEAKMLLETAQNFSLTEFNVEEGDRELDELQNDILQLSISASEVDSELDLILLNFTILNSSAVDLLNESQELNRLAQELLSIAHGAQALANDSVEQGNDIIAEARDILTRLQDQLSNSDNFSTALAELLRNVELAESESIVVENRTIESASGVMGVALTVNTAAETLQNASETLMVVIELAGQLNQTATGVLDNATSINADAQKLASNVAMTTDEVDKLEETVREDKEDIAMATNSALETIATADNITQEIVIIHALLSNLSMELNSTTLLSPDRITSVNQTLVFLEQEAAANQEEVDVLADQIRQLQESANELRESYVQLQQHRDLLIEIRGNIEGLDCRNQFASP